ncbi:type 1 fimbrial protein, partial [Klebsiella pneumoniae]|nr:type 1 fimbrial protein [Klebsiella pneumoniae]
MKKLIFLCMLALCTLYSWATCSGTNSADAPMTNLPEKTLVTPG